MKVHVMVVMFRKCYADVTARLHLPKYRSRIIVWTLDA